MADRTVQVGPYSLVLPEFWGSGQVLERAGMIHTYSGIVTDGVSFDVNVIVGKAGDTAERSHVVANAMAAFNARTHTTSEETFHGQPFEVHRLVGLRDFGPDSVHQMYLCDAHGDLLRFAYSFGIPQEPDREAILANLFLTIATGAIARRGAALA